MELPQVSIRELLEAGVHFGHKTMRWNPKMAPYIFGARNNVHILDLQQTHPLLYKALYQVHETVKNHGRILFVGTKRQASDLISDSAKRCGQYYVNHRWLGGMLTNWKTVSQSISTLRSLEKQLEEQQEIEKQLEEMNARAPSAATEDSEGSNDSLMMLEAPAMVTLTKKEKLNLTRRHEKLERSLGGIRDMGGLPDLLFVIDTNKESLAIREAHHLGIPVIAVLDSNSDPDLIDFPIPGNDDATKAIQLYCQLISDAALLGIQQSISTSSSDVGEQENPPVEFEIETTKKPVKKKVVAKAEPEAKKEAEIEKEPEVKEKEAPVKKSVAKKVSAKDDAKDDEPKKKPAAKKTTAKKPTAKKAPAAKKDDAEKKPAVKKTAKKSETKAE